MTEFAILTNRKRALIALIHSVVFLGIAAAGFLSTKAGLLQRSGSNSDYLLVMIYMTVATVLGWLVSISRGARERLYFALCTCSACSGLLRTIFGDHAIPAAQYMRVGMLSSAVVVGTWILFSYSSQAAEAAASE